MTKKPRAVVFAPYLHTLGGGERVIIRAAQLLEATHEVRIGAPRPVDRRRWEHLGFPPGMSVEVMNARQFMRSSIGADLAVSITNHLPLPSFARRSCLFVQFPSERIDDMARWRRIAAPLILGRYRLIVYSEFVARHMVDRWQVSDPSVIAPPVRQICGDPIKAKMIVSVGRFASTANLKRQDVLLEAWRAVRPALPDWRLVLVGAGSLTDPFVKAIQSSANEIGGVTVDVDAPLDRLDNYYRTATIYWHAAGFGRADDDPLAAEHFGMSTVEAMSAGVIPLVFDDGGQTELVDATYGARWTTIGELVATTLQIAAQTELWAPMGAASSAAARQYSADAFDVSFLRLALL